MTSEHRFYGDLAPWWLLISPPEDYAEEMAFAAGVIGGASIPVREVLELGSGGGCNAAHLKRSFTMTLVDLSDAMLAVSLGINPACTHLQGDMRTVRLGRTFDAVLVHDAVDYMTSEPDLLAAMATAFVHCRPGGLALFMPDATTESFAPSEDVGGTDGPDGRGVRFMDWSFDPDPTDTTTTTEYAFLLREADGTVHAAHDTHVLGRFPRATWMRLLAQAGFAPDAVLEVTTEDRPPRELFLGHRPAA